MITDIILNLIFPQQNSKFSSISTYLTKEEVDNCNSKLKKISKIQKQYLEAIFVMSQYSNYTIHDLIHRSKYFNEWKIAESFAEAVHHKIMIDGEIFIPDPDLIIPVPGDPSRIIQRGYNLPSKIANKLSKLTNVVSQEILIKKHTSISQNKLSRKERIDNLHNMFTISSSKLNSFTNVEIVWLVDDLSTTGTTLFECAKVLKRKYPFIKIYGIVISSN